MISGYSTHSNPHIPAGFRESQVTPVDSAPQPLPQPRGIAQGTAGGLEVCRYLGWPNDQETLDSPCLVILHTCGERMHFGG